MCLVCACLHIKADKRAADADNAVTAVEKTHKRAKALDADIKSTLKKIQGEDKFNLALSFCCTPLFNYLHFYSRCLNDAFYLLHTYR